MTTIAQMQGKVSGLIKAAAAFTAHPEVVFIDDGRQNDPMETALKTVGWCVLIGLPMIVSCNHEATPTAATGEILTVVQIRTNPKIDTGSNPAKLEALSGALAIMKAVLAFRPSGGERPFRLLAEHTMMPVFEDTGALTYQIQFLKNSPLC